MSDPSQGVQLLLDTLYLLGKNTWYTYECMCMSPNLTSAGYMYHYRVSFRGGVGGAFAPPWKLG